MTTAIILAGGRGTRLRRAVSDVPKPMAPVRGRPFLEYQMDYWIGQGVSQFVLSIGYMHDIITAHFGAQYRARPIRYVIENEPMGTGGGLLLAAQGLTEPFLVLNGDTFFEVDLTVLQKFHHERGAEWSFSLFRTDEVGRYMGIEVREDGSIGAMKLSASEPGRMANGGVYLLSPIALARTLFFPGDRLSLEDDLLAECMAQGVKIYGIEFNGQFLDIGMPEDYFKAAHILPD